MRKLFTLFTIFSAIIISSCSADEDLTIAPRKFPNARTLKDRSYNDALTIAQKSISLLSNDETRTKSDRQIDLTQTHAVTTENTRSSNNEQDTLMYIFNFADEQGFVIIPKKANTPEILAITTKGSYDGKETENDGFNMYMSNARLMVDPDTMVIINPGIPIDTSDNPGVGGGGIGDQVITEWKTETECDTTRRGPLLTTKWGQNNPFDDFCYVDGAQSGIKNTPAGCAAIAVAQIMAYHEFPNSINLTYSFAPTTNLTLNWDYWKENSYNDPTGLAIFIRELGERLNMDYQFDGSSSSIVYARNVLRDLSYNTSSIIDYNIYDNKIVPNNIADNLPVYIRGYDVLDSAGHAWVIDGYMFTEETSKEYQRQMGQTNWTLANTVYIKNTYYSFNWGHHGTNDGWFFIERYTTGGAGGAYTTWANVFDPRNTGNDYNTDVRLINNIFPNN